MQIAFTEVPPEARTRLPVREEGVHLPKFKLAPGGEDPAPFSYFPARRKDGGETPDVAIPRSWPAVDEDTMRTIADRLDEL